MTQKSRSRKLRKRLNKEKTDDKPRTGLIPLTGVVRRTQADTRSPEERLLDAVFGHEGRERAARSQAATPGQPS